MPSINTIISNISNQNISLFFENKISSFKPEKDVFTNTVNEDTPYSDPIKIGHAELKNHEELLVFTCEYNKELTARSAKKQQFEIAKKVLKEDFKDGAIFIFYDEQGNFRFSFVRRNYGETGDKKFSTWKRYTYYVEHSKQNKTFKNRIENCHFDSLDNIQEAFSVEPLNKQFYQQVAKSFYELISGKYKLGNKSITVNQPMLELPYTPYAGNETIYKEFAVRLIGRTIFCWFLKNKKSNNGIPIIPSDWLSTNSVIKEAEKNRDYYHSILERLFFIVLNKKHADREPYELPDDSMDIPFLNGGLFEPDPYDFFSVNNKNIHITNYALKIPNEWFKNLFETLEQYNFTIDENSINDTEVSIDPEMLGTIFENLLAEIDPDTEKSARKSTGSFYTPREIVDYMVEQSMVQYLKTKTTIEDEKELLQLFQEGQATTTNPNFTENESKQLLEALSTVKILDPACGSGAFPMGALHKICLALEKLDPNADWWKEQQVKLIPNAIAKKQLKEKLDKSTSDYARKLGVIQNSIYGVDIQPIAAEISKLRSFLSLVIDENIDDEAENRGIEPLPNLEFKFVTANTLIGLPDAKGQQLGMFDDIEELQALEQLRNEYLQSYGKKKNKIKEQFLKTQKKAFKGSHNLFADQNSRSYKLISWNPFVNEGSSWFDPQWMFGEEKFDIVIGNPPYVNIKNQSQATRNILKNNYKYSSGGDVYLAFVEVALEKFISDKSTLTYIIPNNFFGANYGVKIREYLKNEVTIKEIYNLVDEKVFESAAISTIALIISKEPSKTKGCYIRKKNERYYLDNLFDSNNRIQIEQNNFTTEIINKLNENLRLKDYGSVRTGIMGFDYWSMEPIVTNDTKNLNSIKLYTNGNIRPYIDAWDHKEITLYKSKYYKPRIILDKVLLNENTIDFFKTSPKLIIRGVAKKLTSFIDNSGSGLLVAVHGFVPEKVNVELINILLNSNLLNWYHLQTFYSQRIPQGSLKYPINFLESLPIKVDGKISKYLIEKHSTLLEKLNLGESVDGLLKTIETIIYKLYNLTYQEVLIIDPEFSLTQEEYDNYKIES